RLLLPGLVPGEISVRSHSVQPRLAIAPLIDEHRDDLDVARACRIEDGAKLNVVGARIALEEPGADHGGGRRVLDLVKDLPQPRDGILVAASVSVANGDRRELKAVVAREIPR